MKKSQFDYVSGHGDAYLRSIVPYKLYFCCDWKEVGEINDAIGKINSRLNAYDIKILEKFEQDAVKYLVQGEGKWLHKEYGAAFMFTDVFTMWETGFFHFPEWMVEHLETANTLYKTTGGGEIFDISIEMVIIKERYANYNEDYMYSKKGKERHRTHDDYQKTPFPPKPCFGLGACRL